MVRGGAKYSSALDPRRQNRSASCSSSSSGDGTTSHVGVGREIASVALAKNADDDQCVVVVAVVDATPPRR
jgi:hypothetical protein